MGILVRLRGAAMLAAPLSLCLLTCAIPDVSAQTGRPDDIITAAQEGVAPGDVIISEFRFRGPTFSAARGLDGSRDEYVELYNNTNSDIVVNTADETDGWALAMFVPGSSEKLTIISVFAVVPNGTVLPARSHYLLTREQEPPSDENPAPSPNAYSLNAYATGENAFFGDIPDDSGIALFRSGFISAGNRLDSVGFVTSTDDPTAPLYFEGTPLVSPGANDGEYAFVRRMESRFPQDTDDNARDFVFVSTDGGSYGGVQSVLGAPGPENSGSPIMRFSQFPDTLIDPNQPSAAPPNRARDADAKDTNSELGTLTVRRAFTNNTGATVTRLRFRIVDITTDHAPALPHRGHHDRSHAERVRRRAAGDTARAEFGEHDRHGQRAAGRRRGDERRDAAGATSGRGAQHDAGAQRRLRHGRQPAGHAGPDGQRPVRLRRDAVGQVPHLRQRRGDSVKL